MARRPARQRLGAGRRRRDRPRRHRDRRPGGDGQLELGLRNAGFSLDDVGLLVCTHAHADHYGAAGTVVDGAGCELWLHPEWEHARGMVEDADSAWERRIEIARQAGVPPKGLARYEERRNEPPVIDRIVEPDRDLVPGVEIETEIGTWQVHEAPGHAPSHVVLHQPERRLMLSGDHLLGRVSIFYDYGHSPDPVAEFLASLDRVGELPTDLCLAGHGRPFRNVPEKIEANRKLAAGQLGRVRESLRAGPKTAFDTVARPARRLLQPGDRGLGSAAFLRLPQPHATGGRRRRR